MLRRGKGWIVGVLVALGVIAAVSAVTFAGGSDRSGGTEGPPAPAQPPPAQGEERKETRGPRILSAVRETEPVPHGGDAADDPAVWIHPHSPASSTIVATDKEGGLAVYDLSGRQLQYLADGEMNNVDLRAGVRLGERSVTLVAASNRSDDTIALYRVDDRTRRLRRAGSIEAGIEVYGLCMYRSRRSGDYSIFVDSEKGQVEQWQLVPSGSEVSARLVRSFDAGGKVEGCVADDGLGRLYVSEEEHGIWRYGAEPSAGGERTLVDSTGRRGHLTADVEGLAIARGPGGSGWLIASSQGDNSFAIYRRSGDNVFVSSFEIGSGPIDGVEDTDGIEVTTVPLGPAFRHGILVAQDARNDEGNQNFKVVAWRDDLAGGLQDTR